MKFKDFMKAGKFVKLEIGDSIIVELNADPFGLESKKNPFGKDVVEVPVTVEETGEEKIFTVGSNKVANQLSKFEAGDLIKISKLDSDDGKGRWKVTAAKASAKDEDDEEEEDEEVEEKPKKKKKAKEVEEDEEEEEEDEEEEDEKPKKKKKSKKSDDDDDDIDF